MSKLQYYLPRCHLKYLPSWKHGNHSVAPPPLFEIMSKHYEDSSGIGKNIRGKLRLVRVVLMQRQKKKHEQSFQKFTFSPQARWSTACRKIVNKIKVKLVSGIKMHQCVADIGIDCPTYRDHTHLSIWSCWKPAGGGDHGVAVFLFFLCCVLVLCLHLILWCIVWYSTIPHRWSLGLSTVESSQRIQY